MPGVNILDLSGGLRAPQIDNRQSKIANPLHRKAVSFFV
jgi:hypothetical protein